MKTNILNICASADPTSPKTWSGTPFNIYTQLLKNERLGITFSSTANNNKLVQKWWMIVSKIYYNNSADRWRGVFYRYFNARKALRMTSKSNTNYTLHTGTSDLPLYGKWTNQKHFLYCDSTFHLWSQRVKTNKAYTPKLLADAESLDRKAYQQVAHIFPISEYVKADLINYYGINPNKITVVGTGLGVIKPYMGVKNYANGKILFAAKERFEDKGGLLVLEAFKIALEKNPTLELSIVGQNDYTDKINLPNVKTYGFIPIEQLQAIFNESSLFLMPAENEPWGLVYLEAMACKMPIVGLNLNSFPELSGYGKYGFGLDEKDPVKLAEIITNAFKNPTQMAEIGAQAQSYCLETFSWENTVTKILKTIDNA